MLELSLAISYTMNAARLYWRARTSRRRVGGLTFLRFGRFGLSYYVTCKPINPAL